MRTPIAYPVADLVPHAGAMCLLHRVIEGDADSLVAEVDIGEGLFAGEGGVGGWVGIEYMAQAAAAWAGWQARLRGAEPRVGFLLGTRRYDCSRPSFLPGETLRVEVRREFQADGGVGLVACRIDIAGETVATATLTVFEPEDVGAFLRPR